MKKLFKISSVILVIAMLCMMFVVPASAATAGAGISLGLDAVALAGSTVTIPVRAENMQGAAAVEFTVDMGVLTNAQLVAGTWDIDTVNANAAVNAQGDVKVASYGENYTGTLFSIVATVPANANATVSVSDALAYDYNEDEITVTGDSVNVKAYAVNYDGLALVMGETVDLKLYFVPNSDAYTPELTVTYKDDVGDIEATALSVEKNQNGEYFVKIPRYSFEMAKDVYVTATYAVSEQSFDIVANQAVSVQDYFDAQKDKTNLTQATVDALYAMAKYGEIAATYFTTNEDVYTAPSYTNANVAYQGGTVTSSADVDLNVLSEPAADAVKTAVEVNDNGEVVAEAYTKSLSDYSETLVLSSEVCFKLYTLIDKTEAATYTYSYGTDVKNLAPLTVDFETKYGSYTVGENTYAIIKVPVKAYELGQPFYVKATDGEGATVAIVKYVAPDSYIARTWDLSENAAYAKNDITLKTMLSALKVYGNTAVAYKDAQQQ